MDYKSKFKDLPLEKLVEILKDKDQYDSDAVYAAEEELASREVDLDTLSTIEEEIEVKSTEFNKPFVELDNLESKIKDLFSSAFKVLTFKKSNTPEVILKGVGLIFLLISVYHLYNSLIQLHFTTASFTDYKFLTPDNIVSIFFTFAVTFISAVLLMKKHIVGWFFAIYYTLSEITLKVVTGISALYIFRDNDYVTYGGFDNYYLFSFLFVGFLAILLYYLYKQSVFDFFNLNKMMAYIWTLVVFLYFFSIAYGSVIHYFMDSYNDISL